MDGVGSEVNKTYTCFHSDGVCIHKNITSYYAISGLKFLLTLLTLQAGLVLFAQTNETITLEGWIVSQADNEPLEGALITARWPDQPNEPKSALSDSEGYYQLSFDKDSAKVHLFVAYLLHQTYDTIIHLSNTDFNLDTIKLRPKEGVLSTIDINVERAPVTRNGDTIAFNVDAYELSEDATISDLLEILPGVMIDSEGKIFVEGKEVDKVMINGEPFFGNDILLATETFKKGMVKSIEFTNTRTKSEAFTGETGDEDQRTVNLVLEDHIKKGFMSDVNAGYGSDDRYEFGGFGSYFNGKRKITGALGINNVNLPKSDIGFGNQSSTALPNSMQSEGITASGAAGINYTDTWKETIHVESQIFSSLINRTNLSTNEVEYLQPGPLAFKWGVDSSSSLNQQHQFMFNLDFQPTDKILVDLENSVKIEGFERYILGQSQSFNADGEVRSSSLDQSNSQGNRLRVKSGVSVVRKLKKERSYIKLNSDFRYMSNEGRTATTYEALFSDTTAPVFRNQLILKDHQTYRTNTSLSYKTPIYKKTTSLTIRMDIRTRQRDELKSTINQAEEEGEVDFLDSLLSQNFDAFNADFEPSATFFYKNDKLTINIKPSYVFWLKNNEDFLRPYLSGERVFRGPKLTSRFSLKLGEYASMDGGYTMSSSAPQLDQVLNFVDISDPLNVIIGNPDLRLAQTHQVSAGMNYYNYKKSQGVYVHFGGGKTLDDIAQVSTINSDLVTEYTYTNVDGNYNLFFSGAMNKKVKIDSTVWIGIHLALNGGLNHRINFVNSEQFESDLINLSPGFRITSNWSDYYRLNAEYRLMYTQNRVEIDALQNQVLFRHQIIGRLEVQPFESLLWENELSLTFDTGENAFLDKNIWLWNSALTYQIPKTNLYLGVKSYDIFSQNISTRRVVNTNSIEDSENLVLTRYVMGTFRWTFNNLNKKPSDSELN